MPIGCFFLSWLSRPTGLGNCWRILVLLLSGIVFVGFVPAQGQFEDEEVSLEDRIREAEREKAWLGERARHVALRLELLRRARQLQMALQKAEEELEQAEDADDQHKVERLGSQLSSLEVDLDEVFAQLELHAQQGEAASLLAAIGEADLKPLLPEAERLMTLHKKRKELSARLFQAYRKGLDSKAETFEVQAEKLGETFHRRWRVLELKLELHHAREEGEIDFVGELEWELRELQEDTGETPETTTPESPEAQSQPDQRPSDAGAQDPDATLRAVEPSEQEMAAAAGLPFQTHIAPMLKTYCFDCHNSAAATGDLDLETLLTQRPLVINRAHWENVTQQLGIRSMPPVEAEQPPEPVRRTLVAWLKNRIENFDYLSVSQPGYEPARRLTHQEYNNTLRDLLGVDLRPADRFPADLTASSGFENSANSLFIQPITLERYLGAAEAVVQALRDGETSVDAPAETFNGPSSALRRLLADDKPRQAVARLASRAFRRPCRQQELEELLGYFDRLTQQGLPPEDAFCETLQVILISPSLLIRSEDDGPQTGKPFRISDYELASRLSYFLWASMPDEQLRQLASSGTLHQPQVLAAQVNRMLQDDKAETLGSVFAAQWLRFADLDRNRPDPIDNPWATDSLIAAMKQESAMLFVSVLQENAPIERLLDADYTFVNQELAGHYRLPGVSGTHMRRVSLAGTNRRGVLGHGSILAVTSFPGRTSPVLRGNWVLTHLLGTPPPAPPPNVSQFDQRVAENESLSARQKLQLHRSHPNCAACHRQIDPLGFGLAQFDWYGRYRPSRHGRRVDARGRLPSGREFVGLPGLQQALLEERRDDLLEQLARKMFSYALGRQLEYYDEATLRQIIARVNADGRRIQTLVHAIVSSQTFQMKQKPQSSSSPSQISQAQ